MGGTAVGQWLFRMWPAGDFTVDDRSRDALGYFLTAMPSLLYGREGLATANTGWASLSKLTSTCSTGRTRTTPSALRRRENSVPQLSAARDSCWSLRTKALHGPPTCHRDRHTNKRTGAATPVRDIGHCLLSACGGAQRRDRPVRDPPRPWCLALERRWVCIQARSGSPRRSPLPCSARQP